MIFPGQRAVLVYSKDQCMPQERGTVVAVLPTKYGFRYIVAVDDEFCRGRGCGESRTCLLTDLRPE